MNNQSRRHTVGSALEGQSPSQLGDDTEGKEANEPVSGSDAGAQTL